MSKFQIMLLDWLMIALIVAMGVIGFAAWATHASAAGVVHYRLDYRSPVVPIVSPPPAPEPVPPTPTPTPTPEPTPVPPTPVPAEPTLPVFPKDAVQVEFERTCSFNVVKLLPGRYISGVLLSSQLEKLWTDADAKTANKWLYVHPANDCTAKGRQVGYRYSWMTNAASKFGAAYAATGRATAEVRGDSLYVDVTEPVWISGEIAQGIPLSKRIGQ